MTFTRVITLYGTRNLRDFGGYLTASGNKKVKTGVLYRSDQLGNVSEAAAQQVLVNDLHITHTFDLRGTDEAEASMYDFPGITRHAAPIHCANVIKALRENFATASHAQVQSWLRECNEYFVQDCGEVTGGIIKEIIKLQLQPGKNAALFHCSAGKDRTGFIVYLILSLLQVEEDVIMRDYLLSNTLFLAFEPQYRTERSAASACFTVDESYLGTAIKLIKKDYGSVEKYAKEKMNLSKEDIEQLREMLLEDVKE